MPHTGFQPSAVPGLVKEQQVKPSHPSCLCVPLPSTTSQIDGLYRAVSQQAGQLQQQQPAPDSNRQPQVQTVMTQTNNFYWDIYAFDVSDTEYQVVAQQVGVFCSRVFVIAGFNAAGLWEVQEWQRGSAGF